MNKTPFVDLGLKMWIKDLIILMGNIVENQVSDFKDQLLDDKVKTDTQKLRMKL